MGKAINLDRYLQMKDKNNVSVGSWAKSREPGVATCKVCDCSVDFRQGGRCLIKHSETSKHTNKAGKNNPTGVSQLTLQESLSGAFDRDKKEQEEKEKTRDFEIDLTRALSNHKIPNSFLDCLQEILKKHCSDSTVIERMKLGRSKGNYYAAHGIGKTYEAETIKLLKECDGFCAGFDETEINKTNEMEILVKLSHPVTGIELRHYRTLDLYDGSGAENIVDSLLGTFDNDGIDYKTKFIAPMTDGCNTMQGKLSGVKKRLTEKVPQLKDLGSCGSHHISNAMQHATDTFDKDVKEALINIYYDLGGAKGKGLKKKDFEKVSRDIGIKPVPFKKFCSTRFRTLTLCIKPVLFNWKGIVKYYSDLKKPTDRQVLLKAFFVSREEMSLIKINFLDSTLKDLVEGLDFLEKRTELLHVARNKLETLIRNQILKFHDDPAVKNIDEEGNTASKKEGVDLLNVDVMDRNTVLSKKRVFIGQETSKLIQLWGLSPDSPKLNWFFESVFGFYQKLVKKLFRYFETALKSTELSYMSALAPENRTNITTSYQLKYLASSFSKVADNINKFEGQDTLRRDINNYTVDDDLLNIDDENITYEEYWNKVGDLKEGDWARYEVLPRFAKSLGSIFNSNSETERAFSVQSDIHRNPKRNLMSQDMFDSHMQIRFGVESKASKASCIKCKENVGKKAPQPHCHCSVAKITTEMKVNCKDAYKAMKKDLDNVEDEQIEMKLKQNQKEAESFFDEKRKKFIDALKTREMFYKPSLMTSIYSKSDSSKEKVDSKRKSSSQSSSKVNSKDKVKGNSSNVNSIGRDDFRKHNGKTNKRVAGETNSEMMKICKKKK